MTTKISALPANQQIAWAAGAAVTVSTPLLNLTQTWNNAGVAFTGLLANFTDTASSSGTLLLDYQVNGSSQINVTKSGALGTSNRITAGGGGFFTSFASGQFSLNNDVFLARDAANTLALRNGVNVQAFNIYTTYTDASNYERMQLIAAGGSGNIIASQAAGTGVLRPLFFQNGITNAFGIGSIVAQWNINNTGMLLAGTDNTYDIGASGANRPRNLYIAGAITANGNIDIGNTGGNSLTLGAGGNATWNGRARLASPGDSVLSIANNAGTNSATITVGASNLLTFQGGGTFGGNIVSTGGSVFVNNAGGLFSTSFGAITFDADGVVRLNNSAATGFTSLRFGGVTSAFPAWKRVGTTLAARLADDSADAPITASTVKTVPVTVAGLPAAATAGAGARAFVTDATAPTFGATVAGAGAVPTPVYSDGTNWKVG